MGVTEKETLYNKHDFDEINIPAPQKKEDGKIEIPNLTAEDIFKQILLHNEDGYAADCIIATVERIHGLLQKGYLKKMLDPPVLEELDYIRFMLQNSNKPDYILP